MQTIPANLSERHPCGVTPVMKSYEITDVFEGIAVYCNADLIAIVRNKEVRTVRNVYAFVIKVLHAQRARDLPYGRYLTMNQVNYWAKKYKGGDK